MKRLKDAKNVPQEVKAGHQHFTIQVFGKTGGLNPRNMGAVTHRDHLISLDGTAILGDGAETLLHEFLHITWENGGLCNVISGDNVEEKVISIISTQLAAMIHDNPDAFRWIIKNLA